MIGEQISRPCRTDIISPVVFRSMIEPRWYAPLGQVCHGRSHPVVSPGVVGDVDDRHLRNVLGTDGGGY
jgi:hypothetical protein